MRTTGSGDTPIHTLQKLAAWQCERTQKNWHAAAAHISFCLNMAQHSLQDSKLSHQPGPAGLMCSINNHVFRKRTDGSAQGGNAPLETARPRPLGSLAEATTSDERILISEVRASPIQLSSLCAPGCLKSCVTDSKC